MTDKIATTSPDINHDNLAKLRSVFPQFVRDHKVDFDALQAFMQKGGMLTGEEKYSLSWSGKSDAFRAIRTPSTGTLTPQKSKSKNWNDTENIFIEGDNLEVLKLLQTHYTNPGKIKMIYIDPPYNTGKDFVYKDNFHENVADYYERTGQTKDGIKTSANTEKNGRYHSDWLTMMYPRLFLARNLLCDDGVIFVSIDDNEVANLRLIMDEIFGEENFVAQITWKRKRGRDNSARWFSKSHEFILVYAKNIQQFTTNYLDLEKSTISAYKNPDNDKRGNYRMLAVWARGTQGGVEYDFTIKNGQYFSKRLWLFSQSNLKKLDSEDKLIIHGDNIYRKLFLSDNKGKIPETIWDNTSNAANATDEIKSLFSKKIVFDTPKPTPYIREMLKISTNSEEEVIILDFFAGSGTTAHAVMDLNAEDGGKRKCISVQLPELTDEKSEAYKAGYKTIADIARERIRRAGDKIGKGDIGFKSYKLSSSNYRRWHNLTDDNTQEDLLQQTKLFLDKPLVDDYKEKDVVYEILLKEGFGLNSEISSKQEGDISYYTVQDDNRKLVVTFASKLSQEDIASLKLSPDTILVCLDSALDDTDKVNISKNIQVKTI